MGVTVFYSWQSDLPNNTNRGLIQSALGAALKSIAADASVTEDPRLDRDTLDTPGSPDIVESIFSKISAAAAVVCDVSLIGTITNDRPGAPNRATPNPNVLVELGYAVGLFGWDRVVLVFNTAFGRVEDLPFDLRQKRVLPYRASPEDAEKAPVRRELESRLRGAIEQVLASLPAETVSNHLSSAVSAVHAGGREVAPTVGGFMQHLHTTLEQYRSDTLDNDDVFVNTLVSTVPLVADFCELSGAMAKYGEEAALETVLHGLESVLDRYDFSPRPADSWYEGYSDLNRFIGHELTVALVADLLKHRRLEMIGRLLSHSFSAHVEGSLTLCRYHALSRFVEILDRRMKRIRMDRILLHADILKERHEGALAQASPFGQFREADLFLGLAALLSPTEDPMASHGELWRPWSLVYQSGLVAEFYVRAEEASYANRWASALGLPDVETLRARLGERQGGLQKMFSGRRAFLDMIRLDPSKLARR